jgi:hypothetical protein
MQKNEFKRSLHGIMIEIVLVFGVFAIVSVIIVRMFFYADNFSKTAVDISQAVIQAESTAEILKGSASFEKAVNSMGMQLLNSQNNIYGMNFNLNWKKTSEEGDFVLRVKITSENQLSGIIENASVSVFNKAEISKENGDTAEPLCNLNVKKYRYKNK